MTPPLRGLKVLDFTTLVPGPLAGLILAEAGAEVIKVERPGGDVMRNEAPDFAMLNRGKRSIEIDLKKAGAVDRLMPLLRDADILLEQFRPGVMDRLGLSEHLTPQRSNGMRAVVRRIRQEAEQVLAAA